MLFRSLLHFIDNALFINFALFSNTTNAVSAISAMSSSRSKGKKKVLAKDVYPKQDFTYTSAIGQQTIQSVQSTANMYPGNIRDLSEKSVVLLDNFYSIFERNHKYLFIKTLSAAEHQLRSLELQQETKFQLT